MLGIESIKYSLRNLLQRKARSLITILSVFIGIATIFIFISFGIGLFAYVHEIAKETGVDKFLIQAKGMGAPGIDTTFRLKDKDLNAVERVRGVKEAAPAYFKAVQAEKGNVKKFVFGVGVRTKPSNIRLLIELFTVDVLKGRFLKKGDKGKVVLGFNYQLKDKIFAKPVAVGDKILINGIKFDVVGIMEAIGNPGDDSNIYMTEKDIKMLFPDEDLSFGLIIGRVNNVDEMNTVVGRVGKALRKERGLKEGQEDFFVQSYEDAIGRFSTILNIIIWFVVLIALISVVVSAVNTANTMITSVLERTKEIGIMKSVGATNAAIRNIFLFESSFLGVVAGVSGVIAGWGLSSLGGSILSHLGWGFLSPAFPWYQIGRAHV